MEKNDLLVLANFINLYRTSIFIKCAYIKKLPNGKYRVCSEKGKNLGTYTSREQAKKRLRQVEFFKHKKASNNTIDLSHLDDLSYSAIVRELRKYNSDVANEFIHTYKKCFDKMMLNKYSDENVLPITLILFGKRYKLSLPKHVA